MLSMDTAAFKEFAQEIIRNEVRVAWALGRVGKWDTIAEEKHVLDPHSEIEVSDVWLTVQTPTLGEVRVVWRENDPQTITLADYYRPGCYEEIDLPDLAPSMYEEAEAASDVAVQWAREVRREEAAYGRAC